MCPSAGKAISRRQGKFTFVHYRTKMCKFSRRRRSCVLAPGKLFPGAEDKSHSCTVEENVLVFPAPGQAVPGRRKVLERCSGKVPEQGSRENVILSAPGKTVSRRRGKVTFIHYRRKMCKFSWRRGKLCRGTGKAVVGRRGKLCPGPGKAVSRRWGKVSRAPAGLI